MKDRFPESYFLDRTLRLDPDRAKHLSKKRLLHLKVFDPQFTDSLIRVASKKFKLTEAQVRKTLKNFIHNARTKMLKGMER